MSIKTPYVEAILAILALTCLFLLAAQPLLGAPPNGDDLVLHFYRIPVIQALWEQGVPYARWLPDLIYGYGSPLLNFYPPLSVYGIMAFYLLTGYQAPIAINLLFATALALGIGGMFWLGRALYGAIGGLVAAAAYAFSPHLLSQIYERGSTSNALAMGLAPLVGLAFWNLAHDQTPRRRVMVGFLLACILLTHTSAGFLYMGALFGWALLIASTRSNRWAALRGVGLAVALGGGLAAFSWLPAVTEIEYTRYAVSIEPDKVDFASYFAPLWEWPGEVIAGAKNAPLPATIGLGQMILGGTATGLALWSLDKWRRDRKRPFPHLDLAVLLSSTIGLVGWILATPLSSPLWQAIPSLQNLQFPWRFLDIPAFFWPLACGRWFITNNRFSRRHILLVVLFILLVWANAVPYLFPSRLRALPTQPTLADATAIQQKRLIYGLTAWGEYSSSQVAAFPAGPPFASADEKATLAAKLILTDLANGSVTPVSSTPWEALFQVDLSAETVLTFSSHYFPGWYARIDGERTPVETDEIGRLQVRIPAGQHTVQIIWGRTPIRWLADGITLVSALWAIYLFRRPSQLPKRVSDTIAAPAVRPLLLVITSLLLLLTGVKFLALDRVNTPLVRHPSGTEIPGLLTSAWQDFGGQARLAGYALYDAETLVLYWQAMGDLNRALEMRVILKNGRGEPVRLMATATPGLSSTVWWEAGQLFRDVYTLPLGLEERPAVYHLFVQVVDSASGEALPLLDAPDGRLTETYIGVTKTPPPETAVLPADATPINAKFSDVIRLTAVQVSDSIQVGDPLNITFLWESRQSVTTDYTIFIHLLDPDGTLAAANDGQPFNGLYPTSFWSPGERLVDVHPWQPDLPPGRYLLQVGLYDLATGKRLPVTDGGLPDRIIVGTTEIRP